AGLRSPWARVTRGLALPDGPPPFDLLLDPDQPAGLRLEAARVVQLAHGAETAPRHRADVLAGYTPAAEELARTLPPGVARVFPTGHTALDYELARLLAITANDDPGVQERIAALFTPRSHPVDDIHYLIVLARLAAPASEDVTRRAAE